MKKRERKMIGVRLTDEERSAFKVWCINHNTTIQEILENFIKVIVRGDENELKLNFQSLKVRENG